MRHFWKRNQTILKVHINFLFPAKTLLVQIDDKVKSEGLIGAALVGGLAVAAGLLVSLLRRK